MKRGLLLLDVTEMSGSNVCVAGMDVKSGEQIRLADPTPTRALIRRLGGLMPGDRISVECSLLRRPTKPHVEDAEWNVRSVKKAAPLSFNEVLSTIGAFACNSVEAAFGAASVRSKQGNRAWEPLLGERSLATVRVRYARASTDQNGKPRIAFRDEGDNYCASVPFQDLQVKMHQYNCASCAERFLDAIRDDFDANSTVVRVGLTRPYAPQPDQASACWLQVTNIFARQRTHFV